MCGERLGICNVVLLADWNKRPPCTAATTNFEKSFAFAVPWSSDVTNVTVGAFGATAQKSVLPAIEFWYGFISNKYRLPSSLATPDAAATTVIWFPPLMIHWLIVAVPAAAAVIDIKHTNTIHSAAQRVSFFFMKYLRP